MEDDADSFFEAFENAVMRPPREILAKVGFEATPVAGLEGSQLRGRMWELIYALAARRYFFHQTDHLSDREFYVWLVEDWMETPIDDVPDECESNCHTAPDVEASGEDDPDGDLVWLRYYARPEDREELERDYPDEPLPPHVHPPHDRDRFLPDPYPAILPQSDFESGMEDDGPDPLGLRKVDREIAKAKSGEPKPPAFRETWERPAETLKRAGFSPMPPAEVTPETQCALLWELLHELAIRGFYVLSTNHLTDEELYAGLWRHGIREDAILPGKMKTGAWFHDMVGSGSDEHIELWLRYHADQAARENWAKSFPDAVIPPSEKPVADRDWRLPKAPPPVV